MPIIKDWGFNRPPIDELIISVTIGMPRKPTAPPKEEVKPEIEDAVPKTTEEEDIPVLR